MPSPGVVFAIDYGLARVGLARCDETGTVATPIGTVERTGDRALADLLAKRIREEGAGLVVIGIPMRDDDRETPVIEGARRLARHLEKKTKLPVRFVDESFSSQEAEGAARAAGKGRRRVAGERDALAAAEILRRWLEEGDGGEENR